MKAKWRGDDLWNLLNLPISELVILYPNYTKGTLKGKKHFWKQKLLRGEIEMPKPPSRDNPTPEKGEGRLVKTWEVARGTQEDQWDIVTLHSYEHTPDVDGQLFITQAKPTLIRPTKRRKPVRKDMLTLCLGDAQIGYRGTEAFHDEVALELAQLAILELQPDNIVFTGDMIDLTAQSRWTQRQDWLTSTQDSIDRYHAFLAQTRANAPNARIAVVHGNHEARMDAYVQRDAAAILGLRRANAGHELSVLTLQYLTRYEELDVESVDGYPNAAFWLEDNIKVTHGTNVKKGGSNAAKYLAEEDTTTIYGHTHRLEVAYRTIATRLGQRTIAAASPGCLARTDGSVPGHRYSVNNQNETVRMAENWQNGLLVVHHNPTTHDIHPIRMEEGRMRIYDKEYKVNE